MKAQLERRSFPAMGTTIELSIWGMDQWSVDTVGAELQTRSAQWERIFSRFLPESELCEVNRANGHWVPVSRHFVSVLTAAIAGFGATEGRFDPTLLDTLERSGYDRPFEVIRNRSDVKIAPTVQIRSSSQGLRAIEIDNECCAVRLPADLRLDFGGIAKGAFVDSVDELLCEMPGAILDAGGDLRAWGFPGTEDSWRIGIQHPGRLESNVAELHLLAGEPVGVATSSTRSRAWFVGGARQNHLIDPHVGRSVPWTTPSVTVVDTTVAAAEVQTKSILVSLARGEGIPDTTANFVLVAYEDGRYETSAPTTKVG